MSKDVEEFVILGVGLLLLIMLMNGNGAASSTVALAKIQSSTDASYANAASNLGSSIIDAFSD